MQPEDFADFLKVRLEIAKAYKALSGGFGFRGRGQGLGGWKGWGGWSRKVPELGPLAVPFYPFFRGVPLLK